MGTHTRLYDSRSEAIAVMDRLRAARIPDNDISVISPHTGADEANEGIDATTTGAGIGAALGGGAGVLAGVGLLTIPGLGPVVATGWLATTLAGLATGAVVGGVTGGIVDVLTSSGISADQAEVYAEAVRRGGTIITVRADHSMDALVDRLLDETTPVDLAEREDLYRKEGWDGFDVAGPELRNAPRPPFL
jgi:putative NIF3 family GTP cyclohydrolase 1 type 2